MRIARTAALLVLTAALTLAGCSGRMPTSPSAPATPLPVIPVITNGKVAIISIDGLRPDAIQLASAANILALAARGAYTWNAQTIYPSNTLPAHISMLSGYTPEEHGVTWDDYAPTRGQILVPTLFHAARAKGLHTGMVVGKEKFATFRDTGACDTWVLAAPDDDDVAGRIPTALGARPDLLFIHLPDVDLVGHASKWMSEPYFAAVRRADAAVGRILSTLSADTTVILTADHGGHPEGHGSDSPQDITIPWVIAGPSVAKGKTLGSGIRTVDTAATAAFVLGAALQPDASGRPIYEAFVSK
jgi:predicted AlkP superfamily pyrophosphatase or phosphodiesterase